MLFRNRDEAARLLQRSLEKYRTEKVVVLSIPRGGVPMGCLLARHFGWEHGLLLSKKIGHPLNPEYAIGAVSASMVYVDERHADVSAAFIDSEVARVRQYITEREKKFLKDRKQPELAGKTVIIVDDGIATGLTMRLSVQMLRQQQPARIVVAVPVAPPESAKLIREVADELVVLYTPTEFSGVGQFYTDFSEVTDDDVVKCLDLLSRSQASQ